MSTKPQTPTQPPKQARSRKAATADPPTGRAGSAGGVVLSKEAAKKPSTGKPAAVPSKDMKTTVKPETAKPDTPKTQDTPKKKPRKLNRDPTSTPTSTVTSTPRPATDAGELEALKSRVRGLEAKVEDLYKSSSAGATSTPRSPRRRGKGRKNSSATTTATLGNLSRKNTQEGELEDGGVREDAEEEEEAEEELERLESELETARHDLAVYPRRRPPHNHNNNEEPDDDDDVEDIPRPPLRPTQSDRQVTLSGSYRIPLPASLNPEDVRTIQSGVSAAQNVARSFMEQRRARAGPTTTTTASTGTSTASASASAAGGSRGKSAVEEGSGKSDGQTWGDWIGGYSVAISRAVRSIEHEAGVEGRSQSQSQGQGQSQRKKGQVKKRPGTATRLSGEQVQGLMG